jgi:hypothetical protein
MLTTHGYVAVRIPARTRTREGERAVERVEAPTGHSRWEIAALLGTLSLLLPFGLLVVLGL